MLNGSAWSAEKKYTRRYKGTFDIFFGIEHRLRKEEMEEQFNKEAKEGWRFAARRQEMRIASTRGENHGGKSRHQEELWWQLTTI